MTGFLFGVLLFSPVQVDLVVFGPASRDSSACQGESRLLGPYSCCVQTVSPRRVDGMSFPSRVRFFSVLLKGNYSFVVRAN